MPMADFPATLRLAKVAATRVLSIRVLSAGVLTAGFLALGPVSAAPFPAANVIVKIRRSTGAGHASAFHGVSVNVSFAAKDKMRSARRLIRSGHLSLALKTYQHVATAYGHDLIRANGQKYISVRNYVWRVLFRSTALQNDLYDQLFGLQARQQITAAERSGDVDAVIGACNRYFPSQFAADALLHVADRFFEAGRFSRALNIYARLLGHPAMKVREPQLLMRAALASALAGRAAKARVYEHRLAADFPAARGMVAGKRVALSATLRQLLKRAPKKPALRNAYPITFGGNNGRCLVSPFTTHPDTILWTHAINALRFRLQMSQAYSQNVMNMVVAQTAVFGLNADGESGGATDNRLMYSFPILSHQTIYVDTLNSVQALNANSGYKLWSYPRKPRRSSAQPMANLEVLASGPDQIFCTVKSGRVYGLLARRVDNSANPNGLMINQPMGYMPVFENPQVRLVCLDAASGKLIWSLTTRGVGTSAFLINSPLVTAQGIFLLEGVRNPAGMQLRLQLVRVARSDGHTTWKHYLCTMTGPPFQFPTVDMLPSAAHGRIYIATNAGADMAVSERSGRIVWLNLTADPQPPAGQPFGFGPPSVRLCPWRLNPPIVTASRVITTVARRSGIHRIYVYACRTGRRLLSIIPPQRLHLTVLVGVAHHLIFAAGDRAAAFSDATGKLVWVSAGNLGRIVARPVVSKKFLYLPTAKNLLAISTANGKVKLKQPWPPDQSGKPGQPGNLLLGPQQLVAMSDSALYSYARWRDALAYLRGRIHKQADNPENYLSLSQVAFSASHIHLAEQMMTGALAAARRNPHDLTARKHLFLAAMNFTRRVQKRYPKIKRRATFFFSIAAAAAQTNEQRVRWRFAQARYLLDQRHPAAALKLCQQILMAPNLRTAAVGLAGNRIPAEAVIPTFIEKNILAAFGQGVYAPWQSAAQAQIAAANSSHALQAIAYGYANSSVASTAANRLLHLLLKAHRWHRLYKVAALAMAGIPQTAAPESVRLAMAMALLHLHKPRWARILADDVQAGHAGSAEKAQARTIIDAVAGHPQAAVAHLSFTRAKSYIISAPVRGTLLIPAQRSCRWRQYTGALLVDGHGKYLRQMLANGTLSPWRIGLGSHGSHVALVGTDAGVSILLGRKSIFAINAGSGKLLWRRRESQLIGQRHAALRESDASPSPIEPLNMQAMQNTQMMVNPGMPQPMAQTSLSSEALNFITRLERFTGATRFRFARLMPAGVLVAANARLTLLNPKTGARLWKAAAFLKPYGPLLDAHQAGSRIILAAGKFIYRLIAIDSASGAVDAVEDLPRSAHFMRMECGPDATVFLAGRHRSAAYALVGGHFRLLWMRQVVNPLPALAQLTYVGLIELQHNGLICLNAATGTTRWRIAVLPGALDGNLSGDMNLQAFGDTVIVRTPSNLVAYHIDTGRTRWRAELMTRQTPPLVRMEVADPDIALIADGPTNTAANTEKLIFVNQRDHHGHLDNGSIVLSKPLVSSPHDASGPIIDSWYLLNNSVIFSLQGRVFAYHRK